MSFLPHLIWRHLPRELPYRSPHPSLRYQAAEVSLQLSAVKGLGGGMGRLLLLLLLLLLLDGVELLLLLLLLLWRRGYRLVVGWVPVPGDLK